MVLVSLNYWRGQSICIPERCSGTILSLKPPRTTLHLSKRYGVRFVVKSQRSKVNSQKSTVKKNYSKMPISFKSLQFLFVLSLFCGSLRAQDAPQAPEGKIHYEITNNYTKMMASLDYISKQRKERNAYMWGGSQSEWKSFSNLYITPTASKYEDSDEKAQDEGMGYSWRKDAYMIYRNFAAGTMLDHIEILGQKYVIEDSIRTQDWKIMNDLKEVAGHLCMNASWEDSIKQQKIIVWFALDIPHSGGPERLCGLPGLILEVEINDGAVIIVADKIELQKLDKQMEIPKKLKGKKVTNAEYQEVIRKHVAEKKKNEEPWFWGLRYF